MKFVTLLLLVVTLCLAASVAGRRLTALEMWKPQGPANTQDRVQFLIVLKQQNLDRLHQIVTEVSDPTHEHYTKYLTKDQILDIVAPSIEISTKVATYFKGRCASASIENQRDNLLVTCPVSCLQAVFNLTLYKFALHNNPNYTINRAHPDEAIATFPDRIAPYVEFLSGLNLLPEVRNKHKITPVDSVVKDTAAYGYVIPQTVRRVYGVPVGTRATHPKNSQSVIEFSPVGAPLLTDLVQFDQQSGEVFTNISAIVGPFNQGYADGESTLDLQYIAALGSGAYTWYITLQTGWILEAANTVFNLANPPLVNSVSYGWPEELTCSSITGAQCGTETVAQYVARSNSEIKKLAARGISMLIATQDEGAPSEANIACQLDSTHPLWPIYPSSSPWVTAVSGTTLIPSGAQQSNNNNNNVSANPAICNLGYPCDTTSTLQYPCMPNNTEFFWTTGGGFSKYAPRETYQAAAVNAYLNSRSLIPPRNFFNVNNRGYPDVSALGDRILIIQNGAVGVTAGTSAATPIFSGLITLLNDARLHAGKQPLGFLNPLLYQMAASRPASFKIITAGNNRGTEGYTCTYGYGTNVNGWSPVTGLGVPNYPEMLRYVNSLP